MNTRTRRMLQDALIAVLLSIALSFINREVTPLPLAFSPLPLIWLGLRHGGALSVLTAALAGVVIGAIQWRGFPIVDILLGNVLPLLGVGVCEFFARNTQRTLNNLRYSSTYLNIFTASLLTLMIYYGIQWGLLPSIGIGTTLPISTLLLGLGVTWLILAGSLSLLAKSAPQLIIPRRSKYLPRRETSSLLND
ncbi:energy-coupled thiamine transporter ThiT [Dolosicoccus paucivorans]|uniref:ECF transporter S component n=1 Tax=Dolosicoccus paucivorans TaxID=84521 RepID=A0A2N6SMT6_9LACT|nr:energy-coupled thiamine transporter ThiT [Dolosicoccus paucivorans]PMB84503.1 hypothetical protein CJ206_03715 [Dolosicoccus paucivorans]PMC58377.1 hypothetical protein CJ205_04455 [Dolosicoccus paucivorans]